MKLQNWHLWKKLTGILVCVSMLLQMNIVSNAEEDIVVPMSVDAVTSITLSISSGTATAACKVNGDSEKVTKISISMYLQKKSSDSYVTVCTWVGSKESNYFNFKKTQSISKGTYRVKAKITCYTGSTSETTTRYSTAKTY